MLTFLKTSCQVWIIKLSRIIFKKSAYRGQSDVCTAEPVALWSQKLHPHNFKVQPSEELNQARQTGPHSGTVRFSFKIRDVLQSVERFQIKAKRLKRISLTLPLCWYKLSLRFQFFMPFFIYFFNLIQHSNVSRNYRNLVWEIYMKNVMVNPPFPPLKFKKTLVA